ncbi:MAG: glycosyltransferase [Pyrinomonadaceae bacterium]|nr:glycosyltransferase [Pyrinomonadaceae bacterium]
MISVIIVNWNGKDFLPDCLRSISNCKRNTKIEVLVVDNVSDDGSREWLTSEKPMKILSDVPFKAILSEENLGFGRGNNLGIENAGGEYFFFLNPDTIIVDSAIDRLCEALQSDSTIGAVSPKLLNNDRSLQESISDGLPSPLKIIAQALGISRKWDHTKLCAVPVVWGTAILAKRSLIDEIGAFDPDFFMYGEDVELCIRIGKSGKKLVFVPNAEVIHLGGKSSEQAWEASETTLRKDKADILIQYKCLPRWKVSANSAIRGFVYSAAFLRRLLLGQPSSFLKEHIRLHFYTIFDGGFEVANGSKR